MHGFIITLDKRGRTDEVSAFILMNSHSIVILLAQLS